MHIGRTRYRCCPECGERSQQKSAHETISQYGVKSAGSAPPPAGQNALRGSKNCCRAKKKEGTYAMEWGGK